MILAHRGITASARDNSAHAIRSVATSGLDVGIEVDIRSAADTLVMNHNAIEAELVIDSHELAHLVETFGADEIITFEQALELVVDIPVVNLEIKHAGMSNQILKALRNHCAKSGQSPSAFILTSFVPVVMLEFADSEFATGQIVDRDCAWQLLYDESETLRALRAARVPSARTQWITNLLDSVDTDYLSIHFSFVDSALVDVVEQRNKKLMVWEVNEPNLMRELVAHEYVAHVITDYPGANQSVGRFDDSGDFVPVDGPYIEIEAEPCPTVVVTCREDAVVT